MPYSHHSHSGQFCGHADNSLEEMVQEAIARGMQVFALTEHMPRDQDEDMYPEELAASQTPADLIRTHDEFYMEAVRLRRAYSPKIHIFIGFECDWIRPSSRVLIENLLYKHTFDLFVGSIHHVHAIPIDYDRQLYEMAREKSGGTEEQLFQDYFDTQFEMLQALKPPIVGHFDLIRLKSDEPDGTFKRWDSVWPRINRNLSFIAGYGGIVELNSASLRKGMNEPYPKKEICEVFLAKGGRFTISDDSHSTEQIGLNYSKVIDFLGRCGISIIYCLTRTEVGSDSRFPHSNYEPVNLIDLKSANFWRGST